MSFFPRSYLTPESSFTPLFRLLDDYDNYSREVSSQGTSRQGSRRTTLPAFTPKFDVKETETAYELHGELPGIEKENINIEFSDESTIIISGRVERHYTSGNPALEGGNAGAITEGGEKQNNSHKVTVEDDESEKAKQQGSKEVAKSKQQQDHQQQDHQKPTEKYWVSERSVGSFHRTFSFPGRIDQDSVTANLNNGVLSITVPKAKKSEARRIAIQ